MPLYLYYVEDPVHRVAIDSAVEYIEREFPAWIVEPKVDRCRLGTPLCRRPVFGSLLMRLRHGDHLVLPSPVVLYGATEDDVKSLFDSLQERGVRVDVIWSDNRVESTQDRDFVPRLLDNWAEIERTYREWLVKLDEARVQASTTAVGRREAVLTEWLVRMRDLGVPWDRLYFALLAGKIRRPNGREYSRGTIQNRVAKGRAEPSTEDWDVEDSPEVVTLRLKLGKLERTRLERWLAAPTGR